MCSTAVTVQINLFTEILKTKKGKSDTFARRTKQLFSYLSQL